jgi:hypothetical protein
LRLSAVIGKPAQGVEPMRVDIFLDAGDADVVRIDGTENMGGGDAIRIDASLLVEEADARQAEMIDLVALCLGDVALHPDEALALREFLAQRLGVEIGQHRGDELDRFVLVDELVGLGEDRDRLQVGREDLAVAVEDVGPRVRGDDVRCVMRAALLLSREADGDEAQGDHEVGEAEGKADEHDARHALVEMHAQ